MPSSYLFLDGLRVHYLHWNLEANGRPVVLLHGLASNARIWELAAPYLIQRDLVPLAPDLRGHGLTDKPDGRYDFETFFRDLRGFISASDLAQPVLVGHSWGAMLALDYAARMPVGPLAPAGIVLVDGGMTQLDAYPGATWEQTKERLAPPRLSGMPLEDFLDRLARWSPDWQPDDQAIQAILANFEISAEETISPYLTYERHLEILRAMWDFKTYAYYERLRCPLLMVPARPPGRHSPREREYLDMKERGIAAASERIPGLRVHWMAETIHDIPLQRPAELGALIGEFAASLG